MSPWGEIGTRFGIKRAMQSVLRFRPIGMPGFGQADRLIVKVREAKCNFKFKKLNSKDFWGAAYVAHKGEM
jgi:hypothetical protein